MSACYVFLYGTVEIITENDAFYFMFLNKYK